MKTKKKKFKKRGEVGKSHNCSGIDDVTEEELVTLYFDKYRQSIVKG